MAEVFKGIGSQIARDKDIDLGPELDEVAREILAFAIGLAAEHVDTGDFARSLNISIDRSSPSRRDRLVYSDDPAALSIEYGHVQRNKDGTPGEFVEGLHILARAADAVPGA